MMIILGVICAIILIIIIGEWGSGAGVAKALSLER